MKLKVGLVLKVNHDNTNHYIQIINIQQRQGFLLIQILCGKTVNICKNNRGNWYYDNPLNKLADGLLEKIGAAIDKCQPA
jgi:hypothetical protein